MIVQMAITVSFIIILIYMFKKQARKIRIMWAKLQIKLLGIEIEIVGKMDSDADMIILNHQSILDIVILEYNHTRDLVWVAKKEIADIPWFGHILKAPDMIVIERESKSSLVKLIKDSKVVIEDKRVIAIFPEGTRGDGKKIRKFKAGSKIIAQKHKLKVQPVVLIGTRNIFDSQNMKLQGGKVKIIYLPMVEAIKGSTWYEDAEKDMNEIFYKEINSDI